MRSSGGGERQGADYDESAYLSELVKCFMCIGYFSECLLHAYVHTYIHEYMLRLVRERDY